MQMANGTWQIAYQPGLGGTGPGMEITIRIKIKVRPIIQFPKGDCFIRFWG